LVSYVVQPRDVYAAEMTAYAVVVVTLRGPDVLWLQRQPGAIWRRACNRPAGKKFFATSREVWHAVGHRAVIGVGICCRDA
jgi:hypothetical protein